MIMYTHSAEYEEKRNDEREALVELCAELVETSLTCSKKLGNVATALRR